MKVVQVLEQIELFREKLLALDETLSDFTAFESKLSESELYEFLSQIELLSGTDLIDLELLSSIEILVKNEDLERAIHFKRLDISDLNIYETHPDNGNVEELIDSKSEYLYEEIRNCVSPIIGELNTKLEQLLFIPESLL